SSRVTPRALGGIFPGSWIDGNFFIWIGHPDDVRAWRQLRDARKTYAATAHDAGPADRLRAFEEILIAEGSDWCWWYGDDHSSDHDLEFDDLFRRHLRNAYQMLGQPIPEELFATNITTGHVPSPVVDPVGFLHPVIDGRSTSYFEWLAAGSVQTDSVAGAMTASDRKGPLLATLLYGYDLERLFLRLDFQRPAHQVL